MASLAMERSLLEVAEALNNILALSIQLDLLKTVDNQN